MAETGKKISAGRGAASSRSVNPTACGNSVEAAGASRRTAVWWVLVAAWACFIFFMSAHTGDSLDNGNELVALAKRWLSGLAAGIAGHEVDVSPVGHFLEFLVFGGLLYGAFAATVERSPRALVAYAAVVASAYGISDEFHQIFVPGRSCDPADWLVDTVAALVGSALVFLVMRRGALRKNDGMQDEGQGY